MKFINFFVSLISKMDFSEKKCVLLGYFNSSYAILENLEKTLNNDAVELSFPAAAFQDVCVHLFMIL
jgi:hypothetical protein